MAPPYILGETFGTKFTHHESFKVLWNEIWKFQCTHSIYPFNDSDISDFEPIVDEMIKNNVNDSLDESWPQTFYPYMKELMAKADKAAKLGEPGASRLYLRTACIGHIARFPVLSSPLRREIWDLQKKAYLNGASYWPSPPREVVIPHKYAIEGEGHEILAFVRIPERASARSPVPCALMITGLDGYKADIPTRVTAGHFAQGRAYVAVEIPGTGDSPALKMDPESPDRTWSSVLDWIDDNPLLDSDEIAAWGVSTGGYYALRIAHTHAKRLKGVVAQGAGCHKAFDPEWIKASDNMEYPGKIAPALAFKYGYPDVESMCQDVQKRFSLVENKIVEMPHTRLFMIGGMRDSIFPIDDNILMMQYGGPKEARFQPTSEHMGEPASTPAGLEWMNNLLKAKPVMNGH